jgi:hypothetical protein
MNPHTNLSTQRAWKITTLTFGAFILATGIGQPRLQGSTDSADRTQVQPAHKNSGLTHPKSATPCTAKGTNEIKIACDYNEAPPTPGVAQSGPRIVLNRADISFETDDENYMSLALVFTSRGTSAVSEARPVYFEINDDANQNLIRRPIPHVDLTKLTPHKQLTFKDRILVGALATGNYSVQLWIPSADPALKFKVENNLMLDNADVPNHQTGLNTLATISVDRGKLRRK